MTDADYRLWIQKQPSCLTNTFSEYLEDGTGRSIACHVRRARDSGVGYKPPYSYVPMTHEQHLHQHQHGELACLIRFLPGFRHKVRNLPYRDQVQMAKDWFDAKAMDYCEQWEQEYAKAV